jgi:hypothetical protein
MTQKKHSDITETQSCKTGVSGSLWDMKINIRHEKEKERVEVVFKEIKKQIGRKIFTTFGIFKDKEESYFMAKKIYEDIFAYSDQETISFLGIDLKTKLMKGHHHCMNDVIQNEYKKILEQSYEIERLKKRLEFYEKTFPVPFLEDCH